MDNLFAAASPLPLGSRTTLFVMGYKQGLPQCDRPCPTRLQAESARKAILAEINKIPLIDTNQ
ncbi:hypothetical protein D3C81_205370 [compost metagenome]